MKLDGDKIVIESRYEINDIQAMIDCFLQNVVRARAYVHVLSFFTIY